MNLHFYKYQGAGNDFIMVDNRRKTVSLSQKQIEKLCDRHFGIGADGLILLENDPNSDFKMGYYNSDGNESTMCGNGGRCIVKFAQELGIINNTTSFLAVDGMHEARLTSDLVILKMIDVEEVKTIDEGFEVQTGSPHYVKFVSNFDFNIVEEAQKIRYSDRYKAAGINVNFVKILSDHTLEIRTYERGVENETLACGTGITAAAIAYAKSIHSPSSTLNVKAIGGNLQVSFSFVVERFLDIWLNGPAQKVFEGNLEI